MSEWSLDFDPDADRDLGKLDKQDRRRIIDKLDWLLENFDQLLPQPLSAELRDFYKLRVGDWRVVYKIDWRDKVYNRK